MKIQKALVTGGGGFVGKAIVDQLLKRNIETVVVGRNHYPDIVARGVRCLVGNISDQPFMDMATENIDVVFHVAALAGIWGPWKDYYISNVLGTQTVINSCVRNGVRSCVYTSTPSVVFDRNDITGAAEDLSYARKPLCNYARSKIMAEKIALAANSDSMLTCAIRPHLIWGPGDPHLLPRLIESGRKKKLKRVGDGRNLVDISYIENVAYAHLLAAQNLIETGTAAGKAYFVSQGNPVNLWDWINELYRALDIQEIESAISFPLASKIGGALEIVHSLFRLKTEPQMTRFLAEQLAKSHYFSIDNAKNDLGYEPLVTTEDGLKKTIEWLKAI